METNYMTAEELGVKNHICVLPYGENVEPAKALWSTLDLRPYQSYLVNDQESDQLFQSFIFNPISGRKDHYIYPLYTDLSKPVEKKDWKTALKRLFKENYNLDAIAFNTKPDQKSDIWITVPYPSTIQTNFGLVRFRELDFNHDLDRIEAVKWWIDQFLRMWDAASHLHERLTFKGFVWQRVSIPDSDENLVKEFTAYVTSKGFLSLWLQQYGSYGCVDWKEFGFNASCTNPNFYGNTPQDFAWIANTTVFASYYHLGMQIYFGKGELFKERHLYDYLNYGVYNEYMNNSLLVFQFPNQTMQEIYQNDREQYDALYTFIKKSYTPVYPTAAFPG